MVGASLCWCRVALHYSVTTSITVLKMKLGILSDKLHIQLWSFLCLRHFLVNIFELPLRHYLQVPRSSSILCMWFISFSRLQISERQIYIIISVCRYIYLKQIIYTSVQHHSDNLILKLDSRFITCDVLLRDFLHRSALLAISFSIFPLQLSKFSANQYRA